MVYDLTKETPWVIFEVPAMHHLFDCQRYVESGFILNKIKNMMDKNGTNYQLLKKIQTNNSGSFYFISQAHNLEMKQIE